MATSAFSHLALGCPDIELFRRFYCGVFGFAEAAGTFTAAGDDMVKLLDVPDADLEGLFIKKDGIFLELLRYENSFEERELPAKDNAYGFAHLSFRVSNLDDTCAKVEELGGTVLAGTRIGLGSEDDGEPAQIMFVLDPGGNRIELIQHPNEAAIVAHREFIRTEALGWAEVALD
jgi:catechol 2,3-dioxygenase-like lactoylglutathione lyase family enzyme